MSEITNGVQRANITLEAMQEVQKDELLETSNEKLSSTLSFAEECKDTANPFARVLSNTRKKIDARGIDAKKAQKAKEKGPKLSMKEIGEKAQGFEERNPTAFKKEILIMLRKSINQDAKAEDILKTVSDFYPDVTLQDEALQFLLQTTTGEGEEVLHEQVKEAIKQFKELKGPEVEAGKNVQQQAMQATEKGLGNYSSLSELYKDITGNPRDSSTLFDQLSKKYDYKELKAVMDFLLHTLGSNLKTKGTTIPRAELQRLIDATRSLQAITGVYRFFKNRMPLVEKLFAQEGIPLPPKLSFESLSKSFMSLVMERYPSSEKVKQQAPRLGIEDSVSAAIITFNQCRDGVREVALNQIYRSVNHRDELYSSILDALEDFEESLEEAIENDQQSNVAP